MTVLIFIARAFIAGGFQAAYVYTPEVRMKYFKNAVINTVQGMSIAE